MQGLGVIQGNIKGITRHNLLFLDEDGLPLGLLDQQYRSCEGTIDFEGKESAKWANGLRAASRHLTATATGKRTVLVQDREADIFSFFKERDKQGDTDLLVRVHSTLGY